MSADDRSPIEAHLRECPDCADRLEDLSKNEQLLNDLDHAIPRRSIGEASCEPPSILGYTILQQIGRGGMAVVYEAQQHEPRRRVALKVLHRAQFVDAQRTALLRREAGALARLKHPGIAAIHEAGSTNDGQYYFTLDKWRCRHTVRQRQNAERQEVQYRYNKR